MKKFFLLFLLVLFCCAQYAQSSSYYKSAEGKGGMSLYKELTTIITSGHDVTSYSGLWTGYAQTDLKPSKVIWDMYSNCGFRYGQDQCGTYQRECDCYNREHSVPQSWFNESSPMKSDIVHVLPTDGKVNGMRSSYPLGEVNSPTYTSGNGSKLGKSVSGYSGTVFEPIDEYKGDFARIYFYMATRYANICGNWSGGVFASLNDFGLKQYFKNLYLKWHRNDPVSEKERLRNDGIYAVQKNRNPYVDYPELVEYVWGNKAGKPWVESASIEEPFVEPPKDSILYPNPANDVVRFRLSDAVNGYFYYVYDLMGNLCLTGATYSDTPISVVDLTSGIYTFRIENSTNVLSKRLLIKRN